MSGKIEKGASRPTGRGVGRRGSRESSAKLAKSARILARAECILNVTVLILVSGDGHHAGKKGAENCVPEDPV